MLKILTMNYETAFDFSKGKITDLQLTYDPSQLLAVATLKQQRGSSQVYAELIEDGVQPIGAISRANLEATFTFPKKEYAQFAPSFFAKMAIGGTIQVDFSRNNKVVSTQKLNLNKIRKLENLPYSYLDEDGYPIQQIITWA